LDEAGRNHILGRWKEYAQYPDGGNALLEKLLEDDRSYAEHHFRFSILQTVSKAKTEADVRDCEQRWKYKLCTKLNAN